MKRPVSLLLLLGFSLVALSTGVVKHKIVAKESTVRFIIKNLGVNVKGTLGAPKGTIIFDPANLATSRFDVDIDVKSINTELPKRDEHLRSADFFDVEKYPNMHFTSTSIERTGKGYIAYGKLKIKDVEKTVGIPFTFVQTGTKGLLDGSLVIKRMDYGVGKDYKVMGNDVKIFIDVVIND